ncbi:hypothetical protein RKE29_28230 [Streptomyces sp. B1866]|uniref:hypothetical protein n=1 Tax=Streptomyces sp. B1866 TaxID=3075431 RepID=UPI00288EB2C4|nr:hypothetical protein [Streptomyces sp. B1866]MDT3400451.1 hypothetical protein [Streptomyces sp. B1866]
MRAPTLLRVLLEKRGWAGWSAFGIHFARAARRAAKELGNHRLASVTVSSTTFKRWLNGEQIPRGDARMVLEYMLGVNADQLFQPAPSREVVTARTPHRTSLAAALALDSAWLSSSLSPDSPAPGVDGVWRLGGLRFFDGTSVAVQMYEARAQDDVVLIGPEDHPHMKSFVQPSRRALLLASLGAAGGEGLYVLDAAYARRHLAVDQPVGTLPVPAPYRLDDLTYGILWAVTNLDDSLLADDHTLDSEERELAPYLAQSRSAVARSAAPELSAVGAAWLGSRFCMLYVCKRLRDLQDDSEPLRFWCREQWGEEASTLLFFRHRHSALSRVKDRHSGPDAPPGAAFCLPEANVKESERYERVLLFLALALLELRGVTVWVCTEPEYAQLDAFTLTPDGRVIVANWLRGDGIWHVDTADRRPEAHTYAQAVHHARATSVVAGPTPAVRLRALADYLGLDWAWLTARCRELAHYGTLGMLRPRSRLISLDELDATLRFVGGFAAA